MKGQITISRAAHNGDEAIYIRIRDTASGLTFAEAKLTMEALALALTGLSHQDCDLSVHRLSEVGKRRIVEDRRIVYGGSPYNSRDDMEQWLAANAKEDGWEVMPYLGAQGSVRRHEGYATLHYRVQKFIDNPTGETE